MYTWKDIKLATLQKMFAADGSEIVDDESTKDYLAGMPYAANEGLLRLVTAGKFVTKPISLNHMPAKNLIPDQKAQALTDARDVSFTVDGGQSIYLQYTGYITATITGGDYAEPHEVNLPDSWGKFSENSGNLNNNSKLPITVRFTSEYPATIKNIAIYDCMFPEDAEGNALVPEYGKYVKYDLRKLAPDFYNLFDNSICYENGNQYLNTTDYYRENDHLLVLPANMPGMYTIYYHAYPSQITIETEDDYVMSLDPDVAVLLPLYMAAELYKDDDNGIATTYRNEFEVGLESLVNTSHYSGKEAFVSEWV